MSDETRVHVNTQRVDALERAAALSGAASIVLGGVGATLADKGGRGLNPGQTDEELAAGFALYMNEARTGAALMGAATVLGLIFLGPLWSRIRRGSGWLAVIVVAGGVAGAGVQILAAVFTIAGMTAGAFNDGQTARVLMTLEWDTARAVVPTYLAMVAAATIAGFRHHVFGPAFRWFSLAFTMLLTVALIPVGPAGAIGLSGGIWVIAASLLLAFQRVQPARAAES
ncbi:hypothetical protein ACWCOV_36830 [Kribbella sp. NPDC002412]